MEKNESTVFEQFLVWIETRLAKRPYTLILFLLLCFFITSVYSSIVVTPKMLDEKFRNFEIKSTTINTYQDYKIILNELYYKRIIKSIYDEKIDQGKKLSRAELEEYADLKNDIDKLMIQKDDKFKEIEETLKSPLYPSYPRGDELDLQILTK